MSVLVLKVNKINVEQMWGSSMRDECKLEVTGLDLSRVMENNGCIHDEEVGREIKLHSRVEGELSRTSTRKPCCVKCHAKTAANHLD